MRMLVSAARPLLQDLASTILFMILFALTRNLMLSVAVGMAVAIGQIAWQLGQRKRIDALQWVSLVVVIAAGASSLITDNPLFVMLKPSAIYFLVGAVMLRRGWMNRYLPPIAREKVPDLAITFGYVWAGLMFLSAALNLWAAFNLGVVAWGALMSAWSIASKFGLFFVQFGTMKFIGRRRYRARTVLA
jgi:intracellular septation protein